MHSDPLFLVSEQVEKQAKNSRVSVIFDLDSTLFSVGSRTQAILNHLAENQDFKSRFPEHVIILKSIEVLPTDWGVKEPLLRHHPNPSQELARVVRDHWRKHFFSNDFLDHDEIYPEANAYVQHLHQLGAQILYLTGRSRDSMYEGTVQNLKKWGFPLSNEADLIMKPTDVETDESFKAQVLKTLCSRFDHIWFFENEPLIIHLVRNLVPQVRIVYVDSVHSGRAEPPRDLLTISPSYKRPRDSK